VPARPLARDNTYVGYFAGISSTGSYNASLAVALAPITPAATVLSWVTKAGNTNTSGYANTFVGDQAGFRTLPVVYNTFLGTIAGYGNTTGGANTLPGGQPVYQNTTGSYNTFSVIMPG